MRRCFIASLLRCVVAPGSSTVDAVIPGDAQGAGADADNHRVAFAEAIEIVEIDGEALEALASAPGMHVQAAAALHDALHVEVAFHGSRVIDDIFLSVEPAVDEQRGGENPRQGNEAVVDALEDFDFLMIARAALQNDGQRERGEEDDAEEDQDEIEVERGINLAD